MSKLDFLKNILKEGEERAMREAEERALQETGEDILKMSPSMREMNEEFAEEAARKAAREESAQGLSQIDLSKQSAIDEGLGINRQPKSAAESFSSLESKSAPDFELVGEPYSPDYPVAPRVSTQPDVIEGSAQRVLNDVAKPQASTNDLMNWLRRNPRKSAVGAGALGLGAYNLMDGEVSSGQPAEAQAQVAPAAPSQEGKVQAAPVEQAAPTPKSAVSKTPVEAKASTGKTPFEIDVGQAPDFSSDLAAAQEQARRTRLAAIMGMAGQGLGEALSGYKGDDNFYKQVLSIADDPVKQVKQRIESEKDNPNSPTSKAYRKYLERFGIKVKGDMSAAMGEKLVPLAFREFEAEETRKSREMIAKENREARLESANIRSQDRAEREGVRKEEKLVKRADTIRNDINRETKKLQDTFDERRQLSRFIEDAIKDGGSGRGFQDVMITYGFLKSRDNTAVREGEQKLLAAAGSLGQQFSRSLGAALRGQRYNVADMKNLKQLIERENATVADSYRNRAKTSVSVARKSGIPEEDVVRPDIYFYGQEQAEQAPVSDKKKLLKQTLPDGRVGLFDPNKPDAKGKPSFVGYQ